jgi:hypothetical protein
MAATVGDNLSFYLDHLYGELNSDTVVETRNKERIIRQAGIPIAGASAAVVYQDFYVEVPVLQDGSLRPDPDLIPTIKSQTTLRSNSGIDFTLMEDVEFWTVDSDGVIRVASDVEVTNGRRVSGSVVSKVLRKRGLCSSGTQTSETFTIGDFSAFRRIQLAQSNVTQIISVTDGLGNDYYEVENLTHDVVYKNVANNTGDVSVKDNLKVVPAPYRFVSETSLSTRKTTLIFGGGTADDLEDDIIPDPSEFSIPMPFSQTFSSTPVNPHRLLQTTTLGVAAANTTLTVTYRYGGGKNHNARPNTIRTITGLSLNFPGNPEPGRAAQVRNSIETSNPLEARGGDDAPTADDLLALVPTAKNTQERIVSKEDLLARVYTMPSNFGRVFRASVGRNPVSPLSSRLYIISRDNDDRLTTSPDALKMNLKRYLSRYRMNSESIDIMDAAVINYEVLFQVVVDPTLNKSILLQTIIRDLRSLLAINNFHIGQPLVVSEIVASIFSHQGVIAVDSVRINNLTGPVKNLTYSPVAYDMTANTRSQLIYPPEGGIFELKYPDVNITGRVVSNA